MKCFLWNSGRNKTWKWSPKLYQYPTLILLDFQNPKAKAREWKKSINLCWKVQDKAVRKSPWWSLSKNLLSIGIRQITPPITSSVRGVETSELIEVVTDSFNTQRKILLNIWALSSADELTSYSLQIFNLTFQASQDAGMMTCCFSQTVSPYSNEVTPLRYTISQTACGKLSGPHSLFWKFPEPWKQRCI